MNCSQISMGNFNNYKYGDHISLNLGKWNQSNHLRWTEPPGISVDLFQAWLHWIRTRHAPNAHLIPPEKRSIYCHALNRSEIWEKKELEGRENIEKFRNAKIRQNLIHFLPPCPHHHQMKERNFGPAVDNHSLMFIHVLIYKHLSNWKVPTVSLNILCLGFTS